MLYIKFFVFRNIFSKIEKVIITFLILEKIFSKNENEGQILVKSILYILRRNFERLTTSYELFKLITTLEAT